MSSVNNYSPDEIEWLNVKDVPHNCLQGPSISIVLATFNGEKYLSDLLDSLKNQTYPPLEIIIGDDGSSDQTIELIVQFSKHSNTTVGLKRGVNQGSSENFLSSARFSSGDWIIFCDQDDVWNENRISLTIEEISKNSDVCAIFQSCLICDEDLTPRSKVLFPGSHLPGLYDINSLGIPHVWPGFLQVLRRDVVKVAFLGSRPPQDYYSQNKNCIAHDRWTFILASMLGKVSVQDVSVAKFRRHSRAQTGFYDGKKNRLNKLRQVSQIRFERYSNFYIHFLVLQAFLKRDISLNSNVPRHLINQTSKQYLEWATEAKILSMLLGGAKLGRLSYWFLVGLAYSRKHKNIKFINQILVNIILRILRK
jgi:glycosyltransferase involved in cell wall biosynthesis